MFFNPLALFVIATPSSLVGLHLVVSWVSHQVCCDPRIEPLEFYCFQRLAPLAHQYLYRFPYLRSVFNGLPSSSSGASAFSVDHFSRANTQASPRYHLHGEIHAKAFQFPSKLLISYFFSSLRRNGVSMLVVRGFGLGGSCHLDHKDSLASG